MNATSYLRTKYAIFDCTWQEAWFRSAETRITQSIAKGNWGEAQATANEWAQGISQSLGLTNADVWKFFKRSLAARWFGEPENMRFAPGWTVEDALQYATSFGDRSVRFSLFPEDIACHAKSYLLLSEKRGEWGQTIGQVDNSIAMEMFPESSSSTSICFRRYSSCFGEEVFYEAGKGQAMFVFEEERGRHPVVSVTKVKGKFARAGIKRTIQPSLVQEIGMKLDQLIVFHEVQLSSKSFGLCRELGIDYVAMEGYFDPLRRENLAIVDLDLPFDVVFMVPEGY